VATGSSIPSLAPIQPPHASGRHGHLFGALDGCAISLPAGLGAATLVYSQIGLQFLSAGFLALLLGMLCIHLGAARQERPILYAARFFEATTLAAMIDRAVTQLPVWGIADSPGVRLAFLCLIGFAAAGAVGVLYLLRADRFTRFIPAPVFAGFSNSIAIVLVVSQSNVLWQLVGGAGSAMAALSIAAIVLATGLVLGRWRSRWPGVAAGLGVGLLAGLAWSFCGFATQSVGSFGWQLTLPIALADFGALAAAGPHRWGVAVTILGDAAILGMMMFINTTMAAQFMRQRDGRGQTTARPPAGVTAAMALAGLLGSPPLAGVMNASAVASRNAALTSRTLAYCALVCVLVYMTGVLGLIPVAAVCGAVLYEAWTLADRPSIRLATQYVRRRAMTHNAREDLALIAAVMAAAILVNMVAAVFVGLFLGLALFAVRNARQPVRTVLDGTQVSSNCARSRSDLALLAQHGRAISVFELEGDLFFGAADALERSLEQGLGDAQFAVIDWSRVRHIDSSVGGAIAHFANKRAAAGVTLVHSGAELAHESVAHVLVMHLPGARFAVDLDRALEQVENEVLLQQGGGRPGDPTSVMEAATLFAGLTEAERAQLESAMEQRLYRAGEVILQAGSRGDELMVILFGSASVVLPLDSGGDVRLAGARRGATLGDLAFLDRSPRSANVIADVDTTVAVLGRGSYEALAITQPQLIQRLLANVTTHLAVRLRHTNRLAMARNRAL
jgi:sulfate permease, SulP family